MKRLRAGLARLAGILPSERRERDLEDELEGHLQMHMDDNVRSGMPAEEARRQAVLKLGGVESTKEAYRETATVPVFNNLLRDIGFAIRQLRKNPGFTTTAVLMLALGICASVAIFAFVDAALLAPLPYKDAKRLVAVFETVPMFPQSNLSYPDYLDWKKQNTSFQAFDVYQRNGQSLTTPSGVEPTRSGRVSDGFFRTLGVSPVLGRDFYAGEDLPSAPRTLLMSYSTWQRRYAGSPDVLGRVVTLDGEPHTVVGVLPREFHFAPAEPAEFWVTIHATSGCMIRRGCHGLYGVARLKDGVSIQAALQNVVAIAKQLEKLYPENRDQGATVAPLTEVLVGNVRPVLLVLLGGAALLLLIAGVNVASLLLVRSESRKREMAVRNALGASSGRIVSQFLAEGLVLVGVGGLLGVQLARGAMALLTSLIPANMAGSMPYLRDLGLTPRVWAFAATIMVAATILFSVAPALRFSLSGIRSGLTEGTRGSAGTTWRRLGTKLVVLELATAIVLLVGAGLLGKSLYRLLHVSLGFEPEHLAMVQLAIPSTYGKDPQVIALERQVFDRITSLPGVSSVGLSTDLPVTHNGDTTWIRVLGRPWHGEHNEMPERDVSAGYFSTIGAKLLRGRYFREDEDNTKPRVAIVNQAMVRQHFPNEEALGKQVSFLTTPPVPIEIVGIVEDIREGQLDTAVPPVLYLPFNQGPGTFWGVVARTNTDAGPLLPAISAAVREIDPKIAIAGSASMNDSISRSPSAYIHRSTAWLVGGFAAMALLLGVIGIYGVIAYSVSQRTREIGVRMALGAQRSSVYRLILREAGRLIAAGIAIGLVVAVGAARLMRGLLFGVQTWDVPTLGGVAMVLGLAALLASYLPARRAASVSPVEALRSE